MDETSFRCHLCAKNYQANTLIDQRGERTAIRKCIHCGREDYQEKL